MKLAKCVSGCVGVCGQLESVSVYCPFYYTIFCKVTRNVATTVSNLIGNVPQDASGNVPLSKATAT